jgi:hypothetical protein
MRAECWNETAKGKPRVADAIKESLEWRHDRKEPAVSLVREQVRSSRVTIDALEQLARALHLDVHRPTNPRILDLYRARLVRTIDHALARIELGPPADVA